MGPLDIIRVNDAGYSWNSCRFLIDVLPFFGIVSIDFEEKRERKIVYGGRLDGTPIMKTSGKYDPGTIAIKVLSDQWSLITDYLTGIGLGSYGDAVFTMSVEAAELVPAVPVLALIASGCTVESVKQGFEEGVEELLVEAALRPMSITNNSKVLWSRARQIAQI